MKSWVSWFASNHVAANLLMLFVLIAGVTTALSMKLEIFPELEMDTVSITVTYPGASPAEVEEGVVRRIEEKVASITGIRTIDSTARENLAIINLEVEDGFAVQDVLDEVKAEVDRITTLPEESEKPVVRQAVRRSQVISLAVYGNVPEVTLKRLAEQVRESITDMEDITVAELLGTRTEEIHIEISEDTLRRYGLTLGKVAQAVSSASLDLPAGSVKTAGGDILVRTKGRRYLASGYRDVPIITKNDGREVTLGQIATLSDGFADTDLFGRFQSHPAAVIQVYRVAEQNALDVAAQVKKFVEELRPTLPAGVSVDYYSDRSRVLKSRLSLLVRNMSLGLILVVALLGLFLNWRLAFWVTLGIPISFLAGIWALPFFDVSINMVSLFAFIMVLGIVVDDAIVVGEAVYTRRENGDSALKAAVEGTWEIGRPVIFSVLTTVVAFWPLLLAGGTMGKIMRNVPVVVILVLLASLVEALFILPAHLARSQAHAVEGAGKKERRAARWLKWLIDGPYTRALNFCLRWRYATLGAGVAVLLITLGLYTGGILKFTLFPKVDSDVLQATVVMPVGTPVKRTTEVAAQLEEGVRKALAKLDADQPKGTPPLLKNIATIVGLQAGGRHGGGDSNIGGHLAHLFVEVLEGESRHVSSADMVARWREEVGPIPDADELIYQSTLFNTGNPIEVHLAHENNEELDAAVEELKAELNRYPGVIDVGDSFQLGKFEVQLKLGPTARTLGLTLANLAEQVRHAFYGAESLRLQRGRDEVKVLVRYPDDERHSLENLEQMRIRTPGGKEVPFSQVAQVVTERGYTSILRSQRRRVVKVVSDINESQANAAEVRRWLELNFLPQLKEHHPGLRYTQEGEGREQRESLDGVLDGFIIALFGIYALLAIPFKSFTQPFIVMLAIPFGIVGAVMGHLLLGLDLTLLSTFGIVGLSGVVVNDSLVLIHRANTLRDKGMSAGEAIRLAGPMRFRAIILTSLTTFAGLAPMIAERSLQAQFLIPMAVSLGFGVMFATVVTLVLIPCSYLILEDIHDRAVAIKARLGFGDAARQEQG